MQRAVGNRSFAVAGAYHGSGCTLLCVNFAVFLAQTFSEDIAVIEVNSSGDFEKLSLCEEFEEKIQRTENGFQMGKLHYFNNVSRDFSAYLRSQRFGFFVYDMGTDFLRNEPVFLSCNQKIIVGSHLAWRIREYKKVLACGALIEGYREWEYIDMLKAEGSVHFIDDGRIKLKKMPVIEDVLVVSDKAERVYRSFL